MNELIDSVKDLKINKPDDILLSLIDKDFYELAMKYINNEIYSVIDTNPIHDHYIDKNNSKILFNYLINDNLGYSILTNKVNQLIKIYNINLEINNLNLKKCVDYYLENLYIISKN